MRVERSFPRYRSPASVVKGTELDESATCEVSRGFRLRFMVSFPLKSVIRYLRIGCNKWITQWKKTIYTLFCQMNQATSLVQWLACMPSKHAGRVRFPDDVHLFLFCSLRTSYIPSRLLFDSVPMFGCGLFVSIAVGAYTSSQIHQSPTDLSSNHLSQS